MADADLASGQPCVPDHGEQGPQSLAQELLRGVSEPLPHCESVWGRGGGGGQGQVQPQGSGQIWQEQELGPWASIPHVLWEGAENWQVWG